MPELHGHPAVLATPGRQTVMADFQVLQRCNAVSIGILIKEPLQKHSRNLNHMSVLCSDFDSYTQKLHKDMQMSYGFSCSAFQGSLSSSEQHPLWRPKDGLFLWCPWLRCPFICPFEQLERTSLQVWLCLREHEQGVKVLIYVGAFLSMKL